MFRPGHVFVPIRNTVSYYSQQQMFNNFAGEEGTSLCQILANRHGGWGTRLRGDIILNGIK